MIVGFTGTRRGMEEPQRLAVEAMLRELQPHEFHHGNCLGADVEAEISVSRICPKCIIHRHPCTFPRWQSGLKLPQGAVVYHPKAPLDRNHDIVDVSDVMIAAPKGFLEVLRSGTWATIRYARKSGKRLCIVYDNGRVGLRPAAEEEG